MADNNTTDNNSTQQSGDIAQSVASTDSASTWVTVNTSTSANVAAMEFTKSLDYDRVFTKEDNTPNK